MPGLDDALAALAAEIGTEAPDSEKVKGIAAQLKAKAPALGTSLFNAGFLKGQTEGEKKAAGPTTERDAALARVTELEGEIAEIKRKAPDLAAVEATHTAALKKEKDKATAAIAEAQAITVKALKESNRRGLVTRLVALGVDQLYAEQAVAASYDANIDAKADGTVRILQAAGGAPYDGETIEKQLDGLAKDALKVVPAHLITSNTDTGGGTQNDGVSSGGGGFDPKKEGEERGKQQREQRAGQKEKSLAFR
jgi:hypothetical protein